jgi:hypothetical protein
MRNLAGLILLMMWVSLNAGELSGIDAAYYDFDARITALGGAAVALAGTSPAAMIANPAALAEQENGKIFQVSNSTYLDLLSYNYAGLSWNKQSGKTMALAVDFCGDEVMTEYELIFSYSTKAEQFYKGNAILEKLNVGINFKLLGSSFGDNKAGAWYDENGYNHQVQGNSYGFGLDWGMQYKLNEQHRLGLFNRNPLNTIFYSSSNEVGTAEGDYSEARPVTLVCGYCYSTSQALLCLDYDISLYDDRESYLRSGLEINLMGDKLSLRTGLASELFSLQTLHYNFGCGINFRVVRKQFQLDIAYRVFSQWQGHNNLLFGLKMSI